MAVDGARVSDRLVKSLRRIVSWLEAEDPSGFGFVPVCATDLDACGRGGAQQARVVTIGHNKYGYLPVSLPQTEEGTSGAATRVLLYVACLGLPANHPGRCSFGQRLGSSSWLKGKNGSRGFVEAPVGATRRL